MVTRTHAPPLRIGTQTEKDAYPTGDLLIGSQWEQTSGQTEDPSLFTWDGSEWVETAVAVVWNDLPAPFNTTRVPAANAPSWDSFVGNLNAFTFGINDLLEVITEFLHGYKEGSDFDLHVHWVTNGLDGTDRAVNWEIEYTLANMGIPSVGDAFPATVVVSAETTIPANTPDLTHMFTDIGVIAGAGCKVGLYLLARVRRIAAAGTDPSNDPFGLALGVHYQLDTRGSRNEEVK